MSSIRAFIAAELPTAIQQVLAAITEELAPRVPDGAIKWVEPDRMHLTFRFLGDTPTAQIEEIAAGLQVVARACSPFVLKLDRLGCFPNERRPRVIWVGVKGELEAAAGLKAGIDAMLAPLGWEPENRLFQPHLTLGRVRGDSRQIRLPWGNPVVEHMIPVEAVHLIESKLGPQGAVYTVRHTAGLGSTG